MWNVEWSTRDEVGGDQDPNPLDNVELFIVEDTGTPGGLVVSGSQVSLSHTLIASHITLLVRWVPV